MHENEHISNRIDAYLNNELSLTEKQSFESELETNAELKREVEIQQTINATVIDSSILDFSDAFATARIKQKRLRQLKRSLIVACGILLVISVLVFFQRQLKENSQIATTPWPDAATRDLIVEIDSIKSDKIESENQVISLKTKVIISHGIDADQNEASSYKEPKLETSAQKDENNDSTSVDQVITNTSVKSKSIQQNDKVKRIINPCKEVSISAQTTAFASCIDDYTGRIIIRNLKGGTPPYEYNLHGASDKQFDSTFSALNSNDYSIVVTDKLGCITILKPVRVPEAPCFTPEPGFNPDFETWKYELDADEEATITIRNKAGQIILERAFTSNFEWNGTNESGNLVDVAAYRYLITADNLKPKTGSISVIY